MFENLLGQSASGQLIQDIESGVLAPAMLFSGPPASGKGTAALELGRVVSCETGQAAWNCGCPACSRHRLLTHPDLLCLGWRPFSAEIAACAGAFSRETGNAPSRLLFIRSIRKLLARFNPVLWEDEPKGAKISPLVNSLEEDLDELEALARESAAAAGGPSPESEVALAAARVKPALEKLAEGMIKSAFKLESEGMGETIPIAQIRRAAFWSRLAPQGKGKLVIIENADRMQEEARNSLLKLLEEPPGRSRFVLCSARPGGLPRTILSRLRSYRFISRDAAVEADVIRRVFRDSCVAVGDSGEGERGSSERVRGISTYLDSFLPVSSDTLEALAAFFAASVAYRAALLSKRQGRQLPDEVVLLGRSCAPKAEAAGLGRPKGDSAGVIALILEKAEKFELRSLFSRFLCCLLERVSVSSIVSESVNVAVAPAYNDLWKRCSSWADNAVGLYNLRPAQALEKLFTDLSRGMAGL